MTPDTEALVKALNETAKSATPGPYAVTACRDYWLEAAGRGIALFGEINWCGANNDVTINTQPEMEANARFHALCTPENIQSLTAKIAEQAKEIERLKAAGRKLANCAYNLSQVDHVTEREKVSLREAQHDWAALTGGSNAG